MNILRWVASTILYITTAMFLTATTLAFVLVLDNKSNTFNTIPLAINILAFFFFLWYFAITAMVTLSRQFHFDNNFKPGLKMLMILILGIISGVIYFIFYTIRKVDTSLYPNLYYFIGLFGLQIICNIVILIYDSSLLLGILKQIHLRNKLIKNIKANFDVKKQNEIFNDRELLLQYLTSELEKLREEQKQLDLKKKKPKKPLSLRQEMIEEKSNDINN